MNTITKIETKITKLLEDAKEIEKVAEATAKQSKIRKELRQMYQKWYTSASILIQQNLPSRSKEFTVLYCRDKKSTGPIKFYLEYLSDDALQEIHWSQDTYKTFTSAFHQQQAILASIIEGLRTKALDIELLVSASLMDNELEESEYLLKSGFTRAAGAIAGVVLEHHLKELCKRAMPPINIGKRDTINPLAEKLWKANVLTQPQWRKTQWMADVRTLCDHDKRDKPTKEDVNELIKEVKSFIKTVSL